jgi:hypothetical protein
MNEKLLRSQESASLMSVLVLLFPFVIFGPCIVLLSYPFPPPAWRQEPAVRVIQMTAMGLPILVGFAVGWLRRFPIWSYPYTIIISGYLLAMLLSIPSLLDWRGEYLQLLVSVLAILLVIAFLVFFTRRNLPIARLWQDIRADWTRFSLGLLMIPNVLFSSIDHDEDPVLTLFVIGPTLMITLTALAAYILQRKSARSTVLIVGMILTILIRLPSGKWFYIAYWLVTTIIVFFPAGLDLLQRKSTRSEETSP